MRASGWRIAVASVVVLALLSGCGTGGQQAAKPIKVGYLADLAGPCLELAKSNQQAIELAVSEINAAGGLLGRQVQVVARDSKGNAEEGAQQMRRLVVEEQVDFVLGPCSSGVAMSTTELAKQFKKIQITSVANTHRATEEKGHPYFFQVVPNTRMEGRAAAIVAAEMPAKRWVTIALDYEWGRVLSEAFIEGLKERRPDVEIVNQYWPKFGETDYAPFITSILNDKPDAVFAGIFGAAQIAFIRQATPLGYFDTVQNHLSLHSVDTLMALGDETPEGHVMWARAPFFGIDNPKMSTFVDAYQKKYGPVPDDWAVMGYDSMQLLAEAIKKAGTIDSDKVSETLKGMEFDGLRGKFQIRALDGMAAVPVFFGTTTADPGYPFRIFKDVRIIPGDQVWATEDEVRKIRGQ